MPTVTLLFLLLHHLLLSSATTTTQHRRILHQPFFPKDPTQPPTLPPSPSPPTPKYPFSSSSSSPPTTTNNNTPFFPSYPSPPPPPTPTSLSSIPANISSLNLPASSKSKSVSSKLIIAAVAAVIAAVALLLFALFLHLRHRKRRNSAFSDDKTQRSSSSRFSHAPPLNNHHIPKLTRPSQTSSEFLYLGTLVNSHGGIGLDSNHIRNGSRASDSNASNSRKLDSPELHPLPPLNQSQGLRQNCDVGSNKDEENDSFYSPKASLTGSFGNGSASRRVFAALEVQNFNGSTSNSSSTYSGSASGSPVRSASLSVSPAISLSPRNSMIKSPDLIEIQPTRSQPAMQCSSSPIFSESASPSPTSSLSPERYLHKSVESSPRMSLTGTESSPRILQRSVESSPRISNDSDRNMESPPRINSPVTVIPAPPLPPPPPSLPASPPPPPVSVPTPPPPPPAPATKLWESPRTPTPVATKTKTVLEPPALVTPLRPIAFESSTLISPMELPSSKAETSKSEDTDHPDKEEEALEKIEETTTPKPKLKPLHWDKVKASSDREMVWDQLKSSSFKLNEEMIETLFVVNAPNPNPKETIRRSLLPSPTGDNSNRVLDPKKSQNIAILLRALNVTVEEVCEALLEGNTDTLGTELLESLLKMAPTKEEERKLKEYKDDSPVKLGAAEKFLKEVLDIPHAFKRVNAMLYMSSFESEVEYLKKSFETLEAACEELRSSRMFLKLLEAVLKTGNRMNVGTNRGDAHAFKLDTLLKLIDVKGADGKTTLLHFVVQEIIRTEGARLTNENQNENTSANEAKCRKLGLQVVSGLSSELANVKKAAAMDAEVLNSDVSKLSKGIGNIAEVVRLVEAISLEDSNNHKFSDSMNSFMKKAEEEIIRIQAQESVALSLVKEITEYFHGNSAKEEAHPFRIFMVVRDFLTVLDRICKEVGMINERTIVSSPHKFPVPVNPMLQPVPVNPMLQPIPGGFPFRRQNSSSDEGSSP